MAADAPPPPPAPEPKKPQAQRPEAKPDPKVAEAAKDAVANRAAGADKDKGKPDDSTKAGGDTTKNLPSFTKLEKQEGPSTGGNPADSGTKPGSGGDNRAPEKPETQEKPENRPDEPPAEPGTTEQPETGPTPGEHQPDHQTNATDHQPDGTDQQPNAGGPGSPSAHPEHPKGSHAPAGKPGPDTHHAAKPEPKAESKAEPRADSKAEPAAKPDHVKLPEAPHVGSLKGLDESTAADRQHTYEVDGELSALGLTRDMVQDYVKMAYGGLTRGDLMGKYGQLEFFRIRDAIEKLPNAVLYEVAPPPKVDDTVYMWPSGRVGTRAEETERRVREFNPGTPIGGVARTAAVAAGASQQTVQHVGELGDLVDTAMTAPFSEGGHTGRGSAHGEGRRFTPAHEVPHGPAPHAPAPHPAGRDIPHVPPAAARPAAPERPVPHIPRPGDDRFTHPQGGQQHPGRGGHSPWVNSPDRNPRDPRREANPHTVGDREAPRPGEHPRHRPDEPHRPNERPESGHPRQPEAGGQRAPEGHRSDVPAGTPEQRREPGQPEHRPETHERPRETGAPPDVPPAADTETRGMRHYLDEARRLLTEKPNLEAMAEGAEPITPANHPREWRAAQEACKAYDRATHDHESPKRAAQLAGEEYHRRVGAAGSGEGADFKRGDGSLHEVKTHFVPVLDRFVVDKGNQQMLAYLLKDRAEHGISGRGTVEHVFIKRPTGNSPMEVVRITVDPLQGRRLADTIRKTH